MCTWHGYSLSWISRTRLQFAIYKDRSTVLSELITSVVCNVIRGAQVFI